jgi:hypothetical protein
VYRTIVWKQVEFRKRLYRSSWPSKSTSRTLVWDSPTSRAISRLLLNDSRSTSAVVAPFFAGVRTVHERPAFTGSVHFTLHVPRRSCCNWRNTLASGWRSLDSSASVPAGVVEEPRVKICCGIRRVFTPR